MRRLLPPSHGELRVVLPKFLITALRELVKEANARPDSPGMPWTVSALLESWLLNVITDDEMRRVAKRSADFKREATAWMRWLARSGDHVQK